MGTAAFKKLGKPQVLRVGDDAIDWKFYAIGATEVVIILGALAMLLWMVVA